MALRRELGPGLLAGGCSRESLRVTYVARVHGRTLIDADFVSVGAQLPSLMVPFRAENPAIEVALRQGALDGLIERELLAHEAERLGMRVTEQQVSDEFRNCRFYVTVGVGAEDTIGMRSGRGVQSGEASPARSAATATEFDYTVFERTSRGASFGRTVSDLRESMKREMLADRMREPCARRCR